MARVVFGYDPGFKREAAGVGAKGGEMRRIVDDSLLEGKLLPDHITVDAAAAVMKKLERAGHFLPNRDGHDRGHDQLAMGMLEARTAGCPGVLEKHAVHQAAIALQVDEPVAIYPENF